MSCGFIIEARPHIKLTFMNYLQAVQLLRQDDQLPYLGLLLDTEQQYLHFFVLQTSHANCPEIEIFYSGSYLFEMTATEGSYQQEAFPLSLQPYLQKAQFRSYDEITDLYYMIPAQVLYSLFPELPDPSKGVLCKQSKEFFCLHAHELIKRYWK